MLLLSARFEPAAGARPRPPLSPCLQVAIAAVWMVALGLAVEVLRPAWAGVGHGLATGAVHAGVIAIGWLVATAAGPGGAARHRGHPGLDRGARHQRGATRVPADTRGLDPRDAWAPVDAGDRHGWSPADSPADRAGGRRLPRAPPAAHRVAHLRLS